MSYYDNSHLGVSDTSHLYLRRYCRSCGEPHVFRLKCDDWRLCSECRQEVYFRFMSFYSPLISKIPRHRLSQITLTFKNTEKLSPARRLAFQTCIRKLRAGKFWRSYVRGGLEVLEVNHKSDSQGWNLHAHLLVDSSFIPVRELSREWKRITGHSYIVDVRRETNSRYATSHLLKYFFKAPHISSLTDREELRSQYLWTFRNTRVVVSFGSLYNSSLDDSIIYRKKCPVCGGVEWLSEWELFSLNKRSQIILSEPG